MLATRFLENRFFKGKKVLITGHTGFKGAWLSLLLNKLGAQVFGYALSPPTSPNLYDLTQSDEYVNSLIADIRDRDKLKTFVQKSQPEIIIHMAAQSLVRPSYADPCLTFETNIMGTVNLLEAAKDIEQTKVILNVTTDKCYENKEWKRGYHENDALGGYDPYSSSKACSELVTASYRKSFFENNSSNKLLATARSGNIIGGGDWSKDRLIPDFIRSMKATESVVIRNPEAIRPWQYVLDSLFGYLILVEKLHSEGASYAESWNFGPGEESHKTVGWIMDYLCQKWGDKATYDFDSGNNVHEGNFLKLDSTKARKRLNWSNCYSLEQGLDKTIDWYKRYFNGEWTREICESQIDEYIKSF